MTRYDSSYICIFIADIHSKNHVFSVADPHSGMGTAFVAQVHSNSSYAHL